MIKCSRCQIKKPHKEFGKSRGGKNGLYHQCKECANARYREARSKNSNRTKEEVLKAQNRLRSDGAKRCAKCIEVKPLTMFYNSYTESDGKARICSECNDRYVTALMKDRRQETINGIANMYGIDVCFKCGSDDRIEIDHVQASSRGGLDDISNYQLLCKQCNMEKGVNFADYRPVVKTVN